MDKNDTSGHVAELKGRLRVRLLQLSSRVLYALSGRRRESDRILADLKGAYSGKRIFIVCNGPSLKAEDLTRIHENGDISIASNRITGIFGSTPWRPTFYTVLDGGLQYSLLDVMNEVPARVKLFRENSFVTTRHVTSPTVWLKACGDRSLLETPKFSENIDEVIYTIGTVTYAMFQMAAYMGIREMYIIGCDNSYAIERDKNGNIINKGGQSYFKGSIPPPPKSTTISNTWEFNIAYAHAAEYAAAHGLKIYNATRGGHLEAFPRVDFDSLFDK